MNVVDQMVVVSRDSNISSKDSIVNTNLNKIGDKPELPLSSGIYPRNPLHRVKLGRVGKKKKAAVLKPMNNRDHWESTVEKMRMEFEKTIDAYKIRYEQLERMNTSLKKEKVVLEKTAIVAKKDVVLLKQQVGDLKKTEFEQNKTIMSQTQAFHKLSLRYTSVNEALHSLSRSEKNVLGEATNDKGVKAALRTLSKENQECHRKMKILEETVGKDSKTKEANQKKIEKLQGEIKCVKLVNTMLDKEKEIPTQVSNDAASIQNAMISPQLLRVLQKVDSEFDLTNIIKLLSMLKKWQAFIVSVCSSSSTTCALDRTLENAREALVCEEVNLYIVDPQGHQLTQFQPKIDNKYCNSVPMDKGIIASIVKSKVTYFSENSYEDPKFLNARDACTGLKTQSLLCFPVSNDNNNVIAVMECKNAKQRNGFNANDEAMLSVISTQVASFLLVNEVTKQIHSLQTNASRILQIPYQMCNGISGCNMEDICIVQKMELEIIDILGASKAKLFIALPNKSSFWFLVDEIDANCDNTTTKKFCKLTSGICGTVYATKKSCVHTTPSEVNEYNSTVDIDTGSSLGLYAVPILSYSNDCVGVIQSTRKSTFSVSIPQDTIDQSTIELLTFCGYQVYSLLSAISSNNE